MAKYGTFHALGDFLGKTVPKRGSGEFNSLFFHQVIDGLKRLDAVQEANAWVTLSVSTGGGIWVAYKGQRRCMILPAQNSLRVLCGKPGGDVAKALDRAVKAGTVVDTTGHNDYRQWRVLPVGLPLLWDFFESLPMPNGADTIGSSSHPRTFPGPIRQAALEHFERSGSYCPGFRRSRHKVELSKGERIEFDHILPYSRGGASSALNIQVLCQECNRQKRDSSA